MKPNTLTQKAYQHIHDQLSGGHLRPGTRLSNRGVAKEVGVSFTPVREALSRLVSEGFLEYRQGLGVLVPLPDPQKIRDSYELREILESEAAARLCKNSPAAMLDELEKSGQVMEKIVSEIQGESIPRHDATAWQEADSIFHIALLHATGNRRLLNLVKRLRTSLQMIPGSSQDPNAIVGHQFTNEAHHHVKRTLEEHRQIREALKQGDAVVAKSVMTEHIRSGMELALASCTRQLSTKSKAPLPSNVPPLG